MKPLAGPRRFSPVPRNPLKTLNLAGCLVGCSPVPSVVRNPLKTLGSPVLAGPLSRNPHTPYRPRGRGRSLGSALPSGGRRPFLNKDLARTRAIARWPARADLFARKCDVDERTVRRDTAAPDASSEENLSENNGAKHATASFAPPALLEGERGAQ
jgi:hypothetical protein